MTLAESWLLKPHPGKPALLDANILLFHWCLNFDPKLIDSFKRLASFAIEDVAILTETLSLFPSLHTTTVLTLDWPLANSLESRGLNVLNFTHLRSLCLE